MGNYDTIKKDLTVFGNKIFIKELLAPFCLWLGADENQKSSIKVTLETHYFKINGEQSLRLCNND
jgi:hypothetical protein